MELLQGCGSTESYNMEKRKESLLIKMIVYGTDISQRKTRKWPTVKKLLNTINHQGNASQNHCEIFTSLQLDCYYQKDKRL